MVVTIAAAVRIDVKSRKLRGCSGEAEIPTLSTVRRDSGVCLLHRAKGNVERPDGWGNQPVRPFPAGRGRVEFRGMAGQIIPLELTPALEFGYD